jgi:oxygen-independent coproporphyrinogen-3 oxidase
MAPYSLYLHIPFCLHRCAYCDFNTYAGLDGLIPEYTRALCQEIAYSAAASGERFSAHTVFFGGGTPSLLPVDALESILDALHRSFSLADSLELTLEANPGTLSLDYLRALRRLGVNRLSLGMQSASPSELRLLEREHDYPKVIQALTWARKAGFENVNLDLIFGLPHQSLESWQRNLRLAVGLQPEHLSLYALTLEHGTPMQHWVARGLLSEPDPDLAAEMYERASEFLEAADYQQYEISNWARRDARGRLLACRHNLQYWRCLPYLGFGAGAHGYATSFRIANVLSPQIYIGRMTRNESSAQFSKSTIKNLQSTINNQQSSIPNLQFPHTPATAQSEKIDHQAEMGEVMLMGLRLVDEGVSKSAFQERFGETMEAVYGPQIERLVASGLLEWGGENGDSLRLTKRGRLLGNRVFVEFV